MIRNVRTFDPNEITYVDNHREVMRQLFETNNDVTSRFVYKELGYINITRCLLEERYHRLLMQQTSVYYTDVVQPYSILTDQSGEVSNLPLVHLIDPEDKLKKLLRAVTDDEKPTTKLLNAFEKEGHMSSERFPYLLQVSQNFTFTRLFEIFRVKQTLLKSEKTMTE